MRKVAIAGLCSLTWVGSFLLSASCGSDAATESPTALQGGDERWMLQTRVYDADETTGYAVLVPGLAGNITSENAIEQSGGGWVYGRPGKPDGSFLLTHGERGQAIRYDVSKDDKLVEGKRLSFESYGVNSGYATVAFVDAHTAYWLDSAQLQIIRFDPTDMEIEKVLPVDGVKREGFRAWFGDRPVVRDDGVFVTINFSSELDIGAGATSAKGATLAHIAPATDTLTLVNDERCTSLLTTMTTPDGDTYFFSSYENAYVRIAGGEAAGVHDCALRVRKGQQTFDRDWSLDLDARTGGRPADGALPGQGNTIWLRVYHADQVSEPPTDFESVDGASAWQWYALDLRSDAPAVQSTQLPFASHGMAGVQTQGRSFYMVANADYSQSKLLELKDGKFEELATVVGELNTLVRVR